MRPGFIYCFRRINITEIKLIAPKINPSFKFKSTNAATASTYPVLNNSVRSLLLCASSTEAIEHAESAQAK